MADTPIDGQVQRTQTMLYAKASNEPEIRFKRLYKYMTRMEWIEVAIDKILRNRGSRTAGIDGKTRGDYLEEKERADLAQSILAELCTETYHPDPVRQTYIPKANGKKRPLGIAIFKAHYPFIPIIFGMGDHYPSISPLTRPTSRSYLRPSRK
jgi:retron-type reverse transcriptase